MLRYRRQGSRPSPRKRNAKKTKWLSEEFLQIAVKRREAEGKGEKERHTDLNAEFQRIARRDKNSEATTKEAFFEVSRSISSVQFSRSVVSDSL